MKTKPLRIYVETSVFGGVCDDIFAGHSVAFFEGARLGRYNLVISEVVAEELARAPAAVSEIFDRISAVAERVETSSAALLLRQSYLKAGVVTPTWQTDALHVALASTANCAAIVSWNFKHIVNLNRIPLYNAVNAIHGYRSIEIRSPLEVIET